MIDLILILVILALIVPLVEFSSGAARIALGIIFILFLPGYSLIAALFPRKLDLSGVERVALSFGLSIAVVPLIGLILNYTPWGIRLHPILISLFVFILAMTALAWHRRQRLPPGKRFEFQLHSCLSRLRIPQELLDRVFTILLVIAIVGALGTLGYVIATPKVGEKFTEFYILGLEGKAEDYPKKLAVGKEGKVILGIVNHEYEGTEYRVDMTIDGGKVGEVASITLNHREKWEQEVTFTPTKAGPEQKVEFLLYKGRSDEPCLRLHLWIDVKEESF